MRPNTTSTLFALIAVVGTVTLTIATALAQEQSTQPAAGAPASVPTVPARGSTMDAVKAKFGTPTQEAPAVGRPPITRWEYPGYVVFFENDKVLHTVVAR